MRSPLTSSCERRGGPRRLAVVLPVLALLAGCNPSELTPQEVETARSLSLDAMPPMPPDPTNRVADDPGAVRLGEALFNDVAFSATGEVACATCHVADNHFQDGLPRGHAIATTDRRTMPLAGAGRSKWQFWDGRRDSLWAQALVPLEDPREHGGNRTAYARTIAARHRDAYEAVFGPLPDLSGLPDSAGPRGNLFEKAAWAAMDDARRREIDTVFANLGKAIAAFERTIDHPSTRFDRFVSALTEGRQPTGDAAFTDLEREGLRLFIGKAGCIDCHNGPRLSDDHFHNTGVPQAQGVAADTGRAKAVGEVAADPFNCLGAFSDGTAQDCGELRFMVADGPELVRAFKTPSLRGVAQRAPYMHSGQFATLEEVVAHYEAAPEAPSGRSEIRAQVFTERGRQALVAFLKTLDE